MERSLSQEILNDFKQLKRKYNSKNCLILTRSYHVIFITLIFTIISMQTLFASLFYISIIMSMVHNYCL